MTKRNLISYVTIALFPILISIVPFLFSNENYKYAYALIYLLLACVVVITSYQIYTKVKNRQLIINKKYIIKALLIITIGITAYLIKINFFTNYINQ